MTENIEKSERILRGIYCPIHIKNGQFQKSLFKPRGGECGLSVIRFEFITLDACKVFLKYFESQASKYYGVGIISIEELLSCSFGNCRIEVKYRPRTEQPTLPQHAEIYFYLCDEHYIAKKGTPLPSDINFTIKNILKRVKCYQDYEPDAIKWVGGLIAPSSFNGCS